MEGAYKLCMLQLYIIVIYVNDLMRNKLWIKVSLLQDMQTICFVKSHFLWYGGSWVKDKKKLSDIKYLEVNKSSKTLKDA